MNKRTIFRLLLALLTLSLGVLTLAQDDDPLPLYVLPDANTPVYTSGSMALSSNGRLLVMANMLNNTVSLVVPRDGQRLAELDVGADPRAVALTPDDSRALIVNRGDGTLAVLDIAEQVITDVFQVGTQPYAVITDNDQTAYVSLQGTHEIIEIDLTTGVILSRIAVPALPTGLTLWGDLLYVTHLWTGELSLIYLPQNSVTQTISTGNSTALFQSLTIDPANGLAYLPQSRSNADNPALTFDSAVFALVNVVDLATMAVNRAARIELDTADRPVNMPFAAAYSDDQARLYVANAGSNDLSVIDLDTGLSVANIDVDANPRTVQLSRDGTLIYVHNVIDGTVTLIATGSLRVEDVIVVSDLRLSTDILIGAQLFHSAEDPRMARDQWISCANCHFDGQSDGRVWRGVDNGTWNTPVLYGLGETAPYNWLGDWDEIADAERKIRALQVGDGLLDGPTNAPFGDPHAGRSLDLDSLVEYLVTLPTPTAPRPTDIAQIERGAALFVELDCASCHAGDAFTDGNAYDVGTGGTFDTPTLNWLWQSAPYYHDGHAETLREVFILPGDHQIIDDVTPEALADLVAYLNNLPQS